MKLTPVQWGLWGFCGVLMLALIAWYWAGGPDWAIAASQLAALLSFAPRVRGEGLGVKLLYGALWVSAIAFLWFVTAR